MSVNRYGKPVLRDEAIDFNLSHSGAMAALAVARHRRVGIDIEQIESGRPVMRLAERFFSRPEAEKIRALSGEARQRAFYTCWTRKEACVKALGKGLAVPLPSFEVSLLPEEPVCLVAAEEMNVSDWTLKELETDSGYVGAIAVEGGGWHLNMGTWDERGVFDELEEHRLP